MAHLIRKELMADDGILMSGLVAADEPYIGGKRRWVMGRDVDKQPVFGIARRQGRVIAVTGPKVKRATVMPHIVRRVLPKSTDYADEYKTHNTLPEKGNRHRRIQHAQRIYVSGEIHTNTMEGFWSLLKRGIGGVYHALPRLSIFRAT